MKSIFGICNIHGVNIATFDLNLLKALDALLETASVSRASERLNLSQPAVSAALARLRRHLDDPLLVRGGGVGMSRSPLADDLRPRVRRIIEEIEAALSGGSFEPESSTRVFRIVASAPAVCLVRNSLREIARMAPHATLDLLPMTGAVDAALASGKADLAIGSPWELRRCGELAWLGEETMRVVCRKRHPRLKGALSLESYLSERHVLTSPHGRTGGFIDAALETLGHARKVAITAPDFASALSICASSDYLLTCPESVLAAFAASMFQSFSLPVKTPPLRTAMARHKRSANDAALDWVVAQLAPPR